MAVHRDQALNLLEACMQLEYVLKGIPGYCKRDRHGNALPDWDAFARRFGKALVTKLGANQGAVLCRDLLLETPPKQQAFRDGVAKFDDKKLRGDTYGERLIDAVKRVRNNLFHGGKLEESQDSHRDPHLVAAAICILGVAREGASTDLRFATRFGSLF